MQPSSRHRKTSPASASPSEFVAAVPADVGPDGRFYVLDAGNRRIVESDGAAWEEIAREWDRRDSGFGDQLADLTMTLRNRHGQESTRGLPDPTHAEHPILRGVDDVWGPTDVYGVRDLPEDATVLLRGQVLVMIALAVIYSLGLSLVGLKFAIAIGVVVWLVDWVLSLFMPIRACPVYLASICCPIPLSGQAWSRRRKWIAIWPDFQDLMAVVSTRASPCTINRW